MDLDPSLFDDLSPEGNLVIHQASKFLRPFVDHVEPYLRQALARRRLLKKLRDLPVDARHYSFRGVLRGHDADPGIALDFREALLDHGRDIGQQWRAVLTGYREHFQLAARDHRPCRCDCGPRNWNMI